MELIFSDPYYDTEQWEEGKYAVELAGSLSEFDKDVRATDSDIGRGADWPVVLVNIFINIDWGPVLVATGPVGIFLLGDKINKNIDAWLELIKKFKNLIKKFKPTRIDENAAALIAVDDVIQQTGGFSEFGGKVQVIEFGSLSHGAGNLDKRPDSLYVITVRVPDKVFVYGVKSNMNIEFRHEFEIEPHEF